MRNLVLGISAYYHDSAAAIIEDGQIIAAVQEERFTRKKQDPSFPVNAIRFLLSEAGCSIDDIPLVVFYDKPLLKFERLLETYNAFAPSGLKSFLKAMPVWLHEKLFMKKNIWQGLEEANGQAIEKKPELVFSEHHLSHSASAFYPSPFSNSAILTVDGVGEWGTSTIGIGNGKDITLLKELRFPHSVGLLYSSFTYYLGFKVNSGEYKLMGLAPYGVPGSKQVEDFKQKILENIVRVFEDGSIQLNMKFFDFATGLTMCKDKAWQDLLGLKRRRSEDSLEQAHMNLALAIQEITNEIVLRLARTAKKLTGSDNLVLAGGVALNCVANGLLERAKIFENIWIQPAAGDAGGALGAAYAGWHIFQGYPREHSSTDEMKGSFWGPRFVGRDIESVIRKFKAEANYYENFEQLCQKVATLIDQSHVIGWFQGRMEWGPRALGHRSIVADARNPEMQKKLNLQIKKREGFRPFAPAVLKEDASKYFDLEVESPYMLLVTQVSDQHLITQPENYYELPLFERLYRQRSQFPAITHIDNSARVQTVSQSDNPKFWTLINEFKKQTNCSMVINTSFNVRGEPIVCSPEDAFTCFMDTDIDYLVLGNYLFSKTDQNMGYFQNLDLKREFQLD